MKKFYLHFPASPDPGTLPGIESISATVPDQIGVSNNLMDNSINSGAVQHTNSVSSTLGTTNPQSLVFFRTISPRLAAQTISSQVISFHGAGAEESLNSNLQISFSLVLWRPSTGTLVGRISDLAVNSTELGVGDIDNGHAFNISTGSSTSQVAQSQDVLILEVWRADVAQSSSQIYDNFFGFNGGVEDSDTNNAAYISFTDDITIQPQGYAQAQALIKTKFVFAQAQTGIKVTTNKFAQARPRIKATAVVSGQSQASIAYKRNSFGQAQALVDSTRVYGQAQGRVGIVTDLYQFIDEQVPDDTDFILGKNTNVYETLLSPLDTPPNQQNHLIVVRGFKVSAGAVSVNVELLSAGLPVASYVAVLTASVAEYRYDLTFLEALTISSYSTLSLKFTATGSNAYITQAYFAVPANIASTWSFGQSAVSIKTTYNAFAQAQADIKQIYNGFGQAQAVITYFDVDDSFNRTTSNGWGTADYGGPWTVITGNASGYSTDGAFALFNDGAGRIRLLQSYLKESGIASYDFKVTDFSSEPSIAFPLTSSSSLLSLYINIDNVGIATFKENTLPDSQIFGTLDLDTIYHVVVGWTFNTNGIGSSSLTKRIKMWKSGDTEPGWQFEPVLIDEITLWSIISSYTVASVDLTAYGDIYIDKLSVRAGNQAYAQAQAEIVVAGAATYQAYAQAQADIKAIGYGFANAQAEIKQTYQQYAQAQAEILQTYQSYAQAQVDILQIYQAYAQAQADILAVYYGFANAQAEIKQTYQSYAQAQADIKATYQQYAQAQAEILSVYQSYAQAQSDIKVTTNQWANVQTDIKAIGYGFAQAQTSTVKFAKQTGKGQAQALLNTGFAMAQAAALIYGTPIGSDTFTRVVSGGLGTADTGGDWVVQGGSFLSSFNVTGTTGTYQKNSSLTQVLKLSQSLYTHGVEVVCDFKISALPSSGSILFGVVTHGGPSNFFFIGDAGLAVIFSTGQLNLGILKGNTQSNGSAITTITIDTFYTLKVRSIRTDYGTTTLWLKIWETSGSEPEGWQRISNFEGNFPIQPGPVGLLVGDSTDNVLFTFDNFNSYEVSTVYSAQTQAYIKTTQQDFAQAQAEIKQTYQVYAQAQTDIKQVYQAYAQAQADILAVGYGFGQAQADILAVNYGFGQAQVDIKTTYQQYGQAQAHIIVLDNCQFGQAQARILQVYNSCAQAQADILAVNYGFGQAQAKINAFDVQGYGQAQGNIAGASYPSGQAQAKINAFGVNNCGQAQANIKVADQGYGQSQAQIKATQNSFGQAQTDILVTQNSFAQAQAQIKQTYQVYAQSQAWIEVITQNYGQTQAQIKATYTACGQAQARIQTTYNVSGQAQAGIKATQYSFGQSQTYIKLIQYGFGQAQACIQGNAHGQAQAQIKATTSQSGNAQATILSGITQSAQANAYIKVTGIQSFGQAQASIFTSINAHAQTQAFILAITNVFGQAQAFISKSSGYGQAQAYIDALILKNVSVSDRHSITASISDRIIVEFDINDILPIRASISDRHSISISISDRESIGVSLSDESY